MRGKGGQIAGATGACVRAGERPADCRRYRLASVLLLPIAYCLTPIVCDYDISASSSPGFFRLVKSMAQKEEKTSSFRPR